ncbi:MAG: tRNA-dihydrouridine synthase family protein, partial [Planctomycetes bacterium]|nr:tRNA-dihydrouridine synthase family protein [Planctomycetota bacterium]
DSAGQVNTLPRAEAIGLTLDPATYLAPMEGVTDRSFRSLVLEQNPGAVGAACTEFLRVAQHPIAAERIALELGDPVPGVAVGVQLMGNDPAIVAETARRAVAVGAAFVDLNFGCPAPKVFRHCAGSALLDEPELLSALVRTTVDAAGVPVTAKIRAGIDNDKGVEEIARRIEQAGAALLTVHGRLRVEKYTQLADWSRIRRAVDAVSIPVVGNGSAESPVDINRMMAETGCAGVMVGRAAIGNPWIFGAWRAQRLGLPAPDPADAIAWLHEYEARMLIGGAQPRQALGRLKQAAKAMAAASTLQIPDRTALLRSQDSVSYFAQLEPSAPVSSGSNTS